MTQTSRKRGINEAHDQKRIYAFRHNRIFHRMVAMDEIKPFEMLARSIIALAAVDLVATKHPKLMDHHVNRWLNTECHGNVPRNMRHDEWLKTKRAELLEFFQNGGGELAKAANVEHYHRWALKREISRSAAANAMQKSYKRNMTRNVTTQFIAERRRPHERGETVVG